MSATFITWGIPAIVLAAAGLGYVWAWWASRRLTAAYPDSSIAAAYRDSSITPKPMEPTPDLPDDVVSAAYEFARLAVSSPDRLLAALQEASKSRPDDVPPERTAVVPPEERRAGFNVTTVSNKGGFSIQGEVLPEEGSISGRQRDYGPRPNEHQTNEEQPKGTPASTSRP